ncbi:chromatin licensing and DNA replication factor double parked [Lycorma delicatula]|uniref:chromatin licensing and DNA replication factor double parked n=1 Tax=Lycorma delicatula TaxID=130591 RepID=UPI003F510485
MSVQASITEFFNSRKRPAVDSKKISQPSKKVMILENVEGDVSDCPKFNSGKGELLYNTQPTVCRKLIYNHKHSDVAKTKASAKTLVRSSKKLNDKQKAQNCDKNNSYSGKKQLDIRKTFSVLNRNPVTSVKVETSAFEVKGGCEISDSSCSLTEKDVSCNMEKLSTVENIKNTDEILVSEEQHVTVPTKTNTNKSKQELSFGELESKLKPSSRCSEIKAALSRLNEGFSKLEKIREKKLNLTKPSLKQFDTVTFEITTSPSKSPAKVSSEMSPAKTQEEIFKSPTRTLNVDTSKTPVKVSTGMSPAKLREAVFKSPGRTLSMQPNYVSPRKLFTEQGQLLSPTKPFAFQRYQALVTEGRSTLTLPYKYRSLAEIFRGIETVVSMKHNRGEIVTFTKLKSAVQELLRRNLYEKHLEQIKTVYEDSFEFVYEKIPAIGKFQPDRYDLVITPILRNSNLSHDDVNSSEQNSHTRLEMTPDILLNRRRSFYSSLLNKTKNYHEEFLLSLDPPLHVSKDSITRWHPEFDVDGVPDIEPSTLPEPPNIQKVASAKDVLERARNLFGANPRLETAIQKMTESSSSTNSNITNISATTNTGPAFTALTNALKGIPKSLLEKVRAKQAAKALEAMTRSPSQAKEAVMLTRLPEIARIVRNIFISEKKAVLTRELVIKKLADSYRENLSFCDLNEHLNLLQEKTPEWLSFCTLRKTNFVRFVKDADMSRIMAHLESIASDHSY